MKDNWKLLFNPFERIAGWTAFVTGSIIVSATVLLGFASHISFFGGQLKYLPSLSFAEAVANQAAGIVPTVLVMYTAGLIFAKGTRFQDILGTVTLARFPFLIAAFITFILQKIWRHNTIKDHTEHTFIFNESTSIFASSLLIMACLIWSAVLLYNAFRVSTGLKGLKCFVIFALSFIVSEFIILMLTSQL